jgi:hypothetical protein
MMKRKKTKRKRHRKEERKEVRKITDLREFIYSSRFTFFGGVVEVFLDNFVK